MTLIKQCEPKNVVLVHGEASKMAFLHEKIQKEFKIDCFYPANGETIDINTQISLPVDVDIDFLKGTLHSGITEPKRRKLMHGTLTIKNDNESDECSIRMNSVQEYSKYGVGLFQIKFKSSITLDSGKKCSLEDIGEFLHEKLEKYLTLLILYWYK